MTLPPHLCKGRRRILLRSLTAGGQTIAPALVDLLEGHVLSYTPFTTETPATIYLPATATLTLDGKLLLN